MCLRVFIEFCAQKLLSYSYTVQKRKQQTQILISLFLREVGQKGHICEKNNAISKIVQLLWVK